MQKGLEGMKFFEWAEKNKGTIAATFLILFIIGFSAAMYKTNKNKTVKSCTIGQINSIDDEALLTEGQTLVQNYKNIRPDYTEIGFVAHAQTEKAVIKVEIFTAQGSQKETFSGEKLSDGYTYFKIDKSMRTADETDLKVVFFAEKGDFVVAANKTQPVEGSSCCIGENGIDKNIVIDLRTVGKAKINYIIITTATIAFLIAIAIFFKFKNLSIQTVTAAMLSFFCIICMFIFPPFTVPDEQVHYLSTYHVSNLQMFNFSDKDNSITMRECDYEYVQNNSNSLYAQEYVTEKGFDKFFAENSKTVSTDYHYIAGVKSLSYFFGAFGITVARILGIGAYWTFQLSRMFNAAMCIVLLYFAIKIIPYGKCAVAAISLLPMSLHIMASCSYDCFTFGGVMLIFAYIVNLMYTDEKIGWRQLLIMAAMIVLIIPQKVVYIGVAALLLIIPKDKFKNPRLHLVYKCCLGAIAFLSVLLLEMEEIFSHTTSDALSYSETAGFNMSDVLQNPVRICKMLFETVFEMGDFYLKSAISYFGWFEFEPPWFMAVPYVVILGVAFMRKNDEPEALGVIQRTYSLALFVVVYLITELTLLLGFTPIDSNVIQGVQGRYFLPALPLIFLFARNNTIVTYKDFDKKLLFLLCVLNSFMFIFCATKII